MRTARLPRETTSTSLSSLGIDAEAARVYHTLLDLGSCTQSELVIRLRLPEARVESALRTLAGSVLVRFFPAESGDAAGRQICPVSPKVGLTAALARRRARMLRDQADIEQLEVNVAELISVHESIAGQRPGSGIEFLSGSVAVAVRIQELTAAAETGMSFLAPEPGAGALGGLCEAEATEVLDRGLRLRRIHLGSIRNRPEPYAEAGRLITHGARIRTVPVLTTELMLFDGTTALLPHHPQDPSAGAVVITHQGTVATLATLFDWYWCGAEELSATPGVDEYELTAAERELLRLLSEGATDETASRRMGISLRTVRRMTAQLMARLDAKSRFQAGCRAAARGWI